MATCVVTGGAGFLGSHLCEHLLANGHRVICIDNLDTGSLLNIEHIRDPGFEFVNHDLTEFVDIAEPVDFIYHLASPASPIDYMRLPLHTLKVGSYGTHHMLGVAKFKRARFLLASTSEVYGDPEVHPQTEDYWGNVNPIGPRGVYDEAKRYAEAMTMAYHRQQGVNTSIARIFNSILAGEKVLYDDGRQLRHEPVDELAARLSPFARRAAHVGAGADVGEPIAFGAGDPQAFEIPLEGYRVPAFDETGAIDPAAADALVGHPTSQRCFEIRTRYGRSIRVTGDHSLFCEGEGGAPEAKTVNDLALGDRVAIARRIDVPERDRRQISLIEVWRWAEEDPWRLVASAPGLGELVWDRRFDVFGLLASKHHKRGAWRNSIWSRIRRMDKANRVPLPVIWYLGELPADARVSPYTPGRSSSLPETVEITDDLLWLIGLWVAEGCMLSSKKGSFLSISCEEPVLDRAEKIIRETFGAHVVRQAGSTDRGPSIFIHGTLLHRIWEFLGFEGNHKRIPGWILGLPLARLKWFIEGYREGDGVHSGKKLAEGKRHEFSTISKNLADDLVVAFARFGLVPSLGTYETTFKQRTGDRKYPFHRLTLANVSPWSPLDWDRGVTQKLNARVTKDVVWAAITEISEVPPTELVFDFCVPGRENFWAGTGVMAHNTFGNRIRPHDGRAISTFLRQALSDKPVTVFGDGSQTRSFCFVDDLIRGLVALAESDVHTPVNLGNPEETSLLEAAKTVIEVTGSHSEIVFSALPVDDPKVRQPNIDKARNLLGWEPTISLREGLQLTIERSGIERLVAASD